MKKILDKKILNHQATKLFAKNLYKNYLVKDKNFTVFFEGGLGAGKTFIIREILRHFGVTEEVTSPTYILMNQYEMKTKKETQETRPEIRLAHFDLYRLKGDEDFFNHGFEEIADDEKVFKFVEWPNKISREIRHIFSGSIYFIKIKHGISAGLRTIKVYRD